MIANFVCLKFDVYMNLSTKDSFVFFSLHMLCGAMLYGGVCWVNLQLCKSIVLLQVDVYSCLFPTFHFILIIY